MNFSAIYGLTSKVGEGETGTPNANSANRHSSNDAYWPVLAFGIGLEKPHGHEQYGREADLGCRFGFDLAFTKAVIRW